MDKYTQICCWEGVIVEKDDVENFVKFFKDEADTRIKFLESYETLAGDGGEGGRIDVLFRVHEDDIKHFAVTRFSIGRIRWWEDVLNNLEERDALEIIPERIREKYPPTW